MITGDGGATQLAPNTDVVSRIKGCCGRWRNVRVIRDPERGSYERVGSGGEGSSSSSCNPVECLICTPAKILVGSLAGSLFSLALIVGLAVLVYVNINGISSTVSSTVSSMVGTATSQFETYASQTIASWIGSPGTGSGRRSFTSLPMSSLSNAFATPPGLYWQGYVDSEAQTLVVNATVAGSTLPCPNPIWLVTDRAPGSSTLSIYPFANTDPGVAIVCLTLPNGAIQVSLQAGVGTTASNISQALSANHLIFLVLLKNGATIPAVGQAPAVTDIVIQSALPFA